MLCYHFSILLWCYELHKCFVWQLSVEWFSKIHPMRRLKKNKQKEVCWDYLYLVRVINNFGIQCPHCEATWGGLIFSHYYFDKMLVHIFINNETTIALQHVWTSIFLATCLIVADDNRTAHHKCNAHSLLCKQAHTHIIFYNKCCRSVYTMYVYPMYINDKHCIGMLPCFTTAALVMHSINKLWVTWFRYTIFFFKLLRVGSPSQRHILFWLSVSI